MRLHPFIAAFLCSAGLLGALGGCEEPAPSQSKGVTAARSDSTTNVPNPDSQGSRAARPAGSRVLDKTFDDVKFDIEKGESFERSKLNDGVKQLFGERILIRGYMFPTYKRKGIDKFTLVRDNKECCFGPGAAIYDAIRVTLKEGQTVEYSHTPVAVEGHFKLDEYFLDPERTVGTPFHLVDAVVK